MSFDKGRLWEAMDFFNRAVKANPDDARAYYGIGRIYASSRKRESAAENFSKSLRLEKDPERKNQIMNELFGLGQVGDRGREGSLFCARRTRTLRRCSFDARS